MAKSTRSKVKRHFRAKKREDGVYAAAEAARVDRLHAKLRAKVHAPLAAGEEGEGAEMEVEPGENEVEGPTENAADVMELDASATGDAKRVSTHGPRGSRREEWRASKGLVPRPAVHSMNKQGGIAARRKAGRSKRRR